MNKCYVIENETATVYTDSEVEHRTNTKNIDQILETENAIEQAKKIKRELFDKYQNERKNLRYSKILASVFSILFIAANLFSALGFPQYLGLCAIATSCLFVPLSINSIVEIIFSNKKIKKVKKRLKFYTKEVKSLEEELNNLKENDSIKVTEEFEKEYFAVKNEKMSKINKKERYKEIYDKKQNKYFNMFKNNKLTKYLLNKGYLAEEVDLFYQIIDEDIREKVRAKNEEIAASHKQMTLK